VGLEVQYDTTSAQGVARFTGVKPGQWWVNARYERQFDELYWNVPVEVAGARGDGPPDRGERRGPAEDVRHRCLTEKSSTTNEATPTLETDGDGVASLVFDDPDRGSTS
jgi:hypothetical protein